MTTIGVAGVKGAGGVSTVALAVAAAAAATGPAMLVEADPSGGSLLARCDVHAGRDLYEVALARDSLGLTAVAQWLGEVAVVPSWGRPFRLWQALARPRVPWAVLFGEVPGVVVVDVGRVFPDAPTSGVVASLDVVVLVASSEPGPVAATMEWASRGGCHGSDDAGLPRDRLCMATSEVVGRRRGVTVTPRDLALLEQPRFVGHFPHDDVAVDALYRGVPATDRRLRRRPFIDVAHTVHAGVLTGASLVAVGS